MFKIKSKSYGEIGGRPLYPSLKCDFLLTYIVPVIHSVGCTPMENMRRKIVETNRVLIPEGRGIAITRANDINIADQIKPDKCPGNSTTIETNRKINISKGRD